MGCYSGKNQIKYKTHVTANRSTVHNYESIILGESIRSKQEEERRLYFKTKAKLLPLNLSLSSNLLYQNRIARKGIIK